MLLYLIMAGICFVCFLVHMVITFEHSDIAESMVWILMGMVASFLWWIFLPVFTLACLVKFLQDKYF